MMFGTPDCRVRVADPRGDARGDSGGDAAKALGSVVPTMMRRRLDPMLARCARSVYASDRP